MRIAITSDLHLPITSDYAVNKMALEMLPKAVRDAGAVWLEGDAIVHGEIAVAGTIAWYDYSAADDGIRESPAMQLALGKLGACQIPTAM
jgi:hypothetical protein